MLPLQPVNARAMAWVRRLAMGFAALNPSYVSGANRVTVVYLVGWVERSETHRAGATLLAG